MKKVFILILFLIIISKYSFEQEALGLSTDNYSGVWGAQVNPALLTQNKTFLDINFIGASASIANNFAYIPKDNSSFFGPFPINSVSPIYGDLYYNGYYTYYKNKDDKWGDINTRVMGPSISLQYGNHAFAFTNSLRTATSVVNFPWEIPVFIYEDLDYTPLQKIRYDDKDFAFTELIWDEISFSYSNEFYKKLKNSFSFGITGKFLFGLAGMYNVYRTANYKVLDDRNIYFYNLDSDLGYSFDENIQEFNLGLLSPGMANGFGMGADIGIVYTKKSTNHFKPNRLNKEDICSYPYEDYLYRIGFSIIDIGHIKFSKNTGLYTYKTNNALLNFHNLPEFKDMTIDEYLNYISGTLTGDPDSAYQRNNITIGLPTAASLQFDWHIKNPYYLSFIWIHPIQFNLKNVKRTAQVAIIPRYESKFFSFSIPISVINYKTIRTGVAIRIYNITLGTETLGTLLDLKHLDNVNLYFNIKFNLEKGKCNSRRINACSL